MTARIAALLARMREKHRICGGSFVLARDRQKAFADLAVESYSRSVGEPEVLAKSGFLEAFAEKMPISIPEGELIVGSQEFNAGRCGLDEKTLEKMNGMHRNHGHIIVDYGALVAGGLPALRKRVAAAPTDSEIKMRNRTAFERTLKAFARFVERHGEIARQGAEEATDEARKNELLAIAGNCRQILHSRPETFSQGLQLVWFAQIFLHAEGAGAAVSFGRLDQYLWPLLREDLAEKRLTLAGAAELLCCFFIKCCEGDESQNLIVGGVDAEGDCAENPLSLLVLEVARQIKVFQPSLSVRLGPQSSQEFWDTSIRLALSGMGMPSFFNDEVVIQSLEHQGVPTRRARDWGVVGCYEATPQGDTFGMTVGSGLSLTAVLREFLDGEEQRPPAGDFAELLQRLKDFLGQYFRRSRERWQSSRDWMYNNVASPFQGLCLTGCLENGLLAEQGGARFNYFGVNILGIGTLVDSLCVIHELVYVKKETSLSYINAQLKANYTDEDLRLKSRRLPGRYGTDSPLSNSLAKELSNCIADILHGMPLANGQRLSPSFFWFGSDIMGTHQASPDGRREGERVSYGAGPSEFTPGLTPTSILKSTANIAHHKAANGNPLILSFDRNDIATPGEQLRLQKIIEAYFALGGSHLHVNLLSPDDLRLAQEAPADWAGLLVRISGFSTTFVTLNKKWQDAIIARSEKGV